MKRFWLAVARFSAKRAGARVVRSTEVSHPTCLPDYATTSVTSNSGRITWTLK